MRIFLATLTAFFFLTGCSKTTAFDFFKMDENHERAVSSLRTATIVRSFETKAIISSIYLNEVLPETYHEHECFFVALYFQEDIRLFYKANLNAPDAQLTLNGHAPIGVKEVHKDDRLRTLMPIKNDWNRYYIIRFPAQASSQLNLVLENDQYGRATLSYKKEQK